VTSNYVTTFKVTCRCDQKGEIPLFRVVLGEIVFIIRKGKGNNYSLLYNVHSQYLI